jgi:hypothetical protein
VPCRGFLASSLASSERLDDVAYSIQKSCVKESQRRFECLDSEREILKYVSQLAVRQSCEYAVMSTDGFVNGPGVGESGGSKEEKLAELTLGLPSVAILSA